MIFKQRFDKFSNKPKTKDCTLRIVVVKCENGARGLHAHPLVRTTHVLKSIEHKLLHFDELIQVVLIDLP